MKKGIVLNLVAIVVFLSSVLSVFAVPSLDLSFQTRIRDNPYIYGAKEQPDGKLIVRGSFCTINGVDRDDNYIARLNSNGTLDMSFNTGFGPDGTVYISEILSDGKIILQGYFSEFNGVPTNRLALLNPDGSLHTTFDVEGNINGIKVLNNGKFIAYGSFSFINGSPANHMARINNDGSIDPLFNSEATTYATDCHIQTDGKIILISYYDIIRLNSDGSLDESFDIGGGPSDSSNIKGSLLQQDQKLLVWGEFTKWDGENRIYIARLNTNGSLDTGFDVSLLQKYSYERVEGMLQQGSGKIILWGNSLTTSDDVRRSLVRLNNDGTLDITFDNSHYYTYMRVGLRGDDGIIVVYHSKVFRLDSDGNEDPIFTTNTGTCADKIIRGIELLSGGRILLYSSDGLTSFNGHPRTRIAMIDETGILDAFNPVMERPGQVTAHCVQTDGKVIIGGNFRSVDGELRRRLARLNADGSLDMEFDVGTGIDSTYWNIQVKDIACQSSGKIMVGGMFESYNENLTYSLVRLNPDGSLETSYTGSGYSGVEDIDILNNDKIYIGGGMREVNGTSVNRIARLNADGTVDGSFNSGISAGYSDSIYEIIEQADGKVIVGGSLSSGNIARLNTDGTLDASFNLASGINSVVNMALQSDEKILFDTNYSGTFRLNNDGSLDNSFALTGGYTIYRTPFYILPCSRILGGNSNELFLFDQYGIVDETSVIITNSNVECIDKQGDTGLIIGGLFSTIDGEQRWGLARLILDPVISGQVNLTIAGYDNLTVKNASISLEGTSFTTTTDENGNFEIHGIPAGIYTLIVTAPNLVPLSLQVTVEQDMQPVSISMQGGTCTQAQLDQAVADAEFVKEQIIDNLNARLINAEMGDFDNDGDVDGDDLADFAHNFGL